jgi:hypothetical protein
MQTFLFYQPENDPPVQVDDIADALHDLAGVAFAAPRHATYRPGEWHDPATGASCRFDLGEADLEHDDTEKPVHYAGWRPLPISVHIPLAGPHWFAVEALAVVEKILQVFPDLRPLDTEDTRADPEADAGPFPWSKLRALANWERLHHAQCSGRTDVPRMNRAMSLALWRYRRERPHGKRQHPHLTWPEAHVLLDGERAVSAALWADPGVPLALPPVELIVIQRHDSTGVLPSDELRTAAGGGLPLELAQAVALTDTARLTDLYTRAKLMPATRFRALLDGDWGD